MKPRKTLALTMPLLLCGCSGTQLLSKPAPDFDRSYEISAQIDYGSYTAAADILRSGSGEWEFHFTEPSYLMGMELSLSDGELTASLGDISVTADSSSVYTVIPDVISTALDSLSAVSTDSITENEGVLTLTTSAHGDKTVITSDSSGGLLTLRCPARQLSVKFSGQQEIDVTETAETFEFIVEG